MPDDLQSLLRRADDRASHSKRSMLTLALSRFEEIFDMNSWMAWKLMRGLPVPDDRILRYRHIAPEKGVEEYHKGRESIRARFNRDPRVKTWLDQYEELCELRGAAP